ncbi:DnaD domain protein [Bacillus sp. APMAM]|nr:DnaD domain protein [Bacillus sp. APMAM]RTZ56613.1 DnaD domain protein [Bacillus sp. SAJ1]
MGGYISQKIIQWCEDLSEELVLEAMKLAVEQVKKTWRYVEAILNNWAEKKISNVDQVNALQLKHKEKRSKQHNSQQNRSRPLRNEKLPDWFRNKNQENRPPIPVLTNNKETPDERRERLLKIQEKYRKGSTT